MVGFLLDLVPQLCSFKFVIPESANSAGVGSTIFFSHTAADAQIGSHTSISRQVAFLYFLYVFFNWEKKLRALGLGKFIG